MITILLEYTQYILPSEYPYSEYTQDLLRMNSIYYQNTLKKILRTLKYTRDYLKNSSDPPN